MARLGRLSLGKIFGLATLAIVGLVLVTQGGELFSPGALSRKTSGAKLGGVSAHAELNGNCSACHAPPWSSSTMANRCMECHTQILAQIEGHQPLHGLLTDGMKCRACHTEHKGPRAALTSLAHFDHECAAFKLTGHHKSLECGSCHKDNAYRGTPQTCAACHVEPQVHLGRFGTECAQCHSTATWKGANVSAEKFDHDSTGFKLTGKHTMLNCKQCHVNEVFKGTSQSCASCHAEPQVHKGKYGDGCAQCHTTNSWTGATFKHTFPLTHGTRNKKASDCATCHKKADDFKTYTCYGCHQHDPAREERRHTKRGIANFQNCVKCHKTGRGHERRGWLEEMPAFGSPAALCEAPSSDERFALHPLSKLSPTLRPEVNPMAEKELTTLFPPLPEWTTRLDASVNMLRFAIQCQTPDLARRPGVSASLRLD